ncbi:MAG: molecular chaperone TorD family protein [Conexivisphaerales archaeon]
MMSDYRSVSADYRIFSYIMLGPKYSSDVKELAAQASSRPYGSEILQLSDILEHDDNEKLITEYTSCMVNDFRELKCPPYESWYTERTIYGRVVGNLMQLYSKYGIHPQKELPDHISTEMEFVSFLYFVQQVEEANNFVNKHIINWAPKLAMDIIANAKGNYTRLIGVSLTRFIEREKGRLKVNY